MKACSISMKLRLLTTFTLLASVAQLSAAELPEDTKKALKEMKNYLLKEEKAYLERKQKIYDYYIKGLKEQRQQATNNGQKDAATAIGKELIKVMEAKGNIALPSAFNGNTTSLEKKTSIPEIEPGTKFHEVADYFNKHEDAIKTVKVDIGKPSESLKVSGSCLLAPYSNDKWSIFAAKGGGRGGGSKGSNFKGITQSNRKINGQAPGALCYSINNGPWKAIKDVELVKVNGTIKFASNTHNIDMLKGRGEGTIRVRVLPTN